jgi:thiol-disulfide isomerase/thioredoxin
LNNLTNTNLYILEKTVTKLLINLIFTCSVTGCSQPQFALINGGTVTIPDRNGWILVNFWAPWCAPCLEEIPQLNLLAAQMPKPLIAVVGVHFDAITNSELELQIEHYKVQFNTLSKENHSLPVPIPEMLPANYLISPDGKLHGPLLGPQTYDSILEAISSYNSN